MEVHKHVHKQQPWWIFLLDYCYSGLKISPFSCHLVQNKNLPSKELNYKALEIKQLDTISSMYITQEKTTYSIRINTIRRANGYNTLVGRVCVCNGCVHWSMRKSLMADYFVQYGRLYNLHDNCWYLKAQTPTTMCLGSWILEILCSNGWVDKSVKFFRDMSSRTQTIVNDADE